MSDLSQLFQSLNQEQLQAVKYNDGPLIITAGPGTGKTKTLTNKIVYLLKEKKVNPAQILALTFTKKAAFEIEERLLAALNFKKRHDKFPLVATFHSLAFQLLENDKKLNLISEKDRHQIIKEILKAEKLSRNLAKLDAKELSLLISRWKNLSLNSEQELLNEQIKNLIDQYQQALKEKDLVDYDDLLVKLLTALKNRQFKKYQYVLVDEYQDTNEIQYQIVKLLADQKQNITVIGDPRQAIYSFRGAQAQAFEQFKQDFKNCQQINLQLNYRNSPNILKGSQQLFEKTINLKANRKSNGEFKLLKTFNEYTEADWIINCLSQKLGGIDFHQASDFSSDDQQARFSDFAIVYRIHSLGRVLEKKFQESGIPYQIVGGKSLYEQKEVKFITNLLKYLNNDSKELLQELIDSKVVDNKSLIFELNDIKENAQPIVLIEEIIKKFNLEEKYQDKVKQLRNIYEFKTIVQSFDEKEVSNELSLEKFVDHLENLEKHDFYDQSADRVTLMSMHAAKGLEFDYVFVCAFEDGFIPFEKKFKSVVDLEEEKRLLYVAMTRAKKGLYLVNANYRFKKEQQISSFKNLIPSAQLEEINDEVLERMRKRKEKEVEKKRQMTLF